VLADCEPPLCIIYPTADKMECAPDEYPDEEEAVIQTTEYYRQMFEIDKKIENLLEFRSILSKFNSDNFERLINTNSNLKLLSRIPDVGDIPTIASFRRLNPIFSIGSPRTNAEDLFLKTFPLMTESLRRNIIADNECFSIYSDRLIRGSVEWNLHKWVLNFRSKQTAIQFKLSEEEAVIHALELEKVNWLGNANTDDLIRLRCNGQMEEMRNFFRISRTELKRASFR